MEGGVIFTDLDGTLLDEITYEYVAARPALDALKEHSVPLVLCSSKTQAEMQALHRDLGLSGPYVVENGGAIVIPGRRRPRILVLGAERERLVTVLREIAREVGVELRGLASFSLADVVGFTGLPVAQAVLARRRAYDEPFLMEAGAEEAVAAAAARRGLRVSRGGRFHHLTADVGKGQAVKEVLRRCFQGVVRTVALGDAANDLDMLQAVERPVIIPRPEGRLDAALASALPDAEVAPAPGPSGWNQAVLTMLSGGRLSRVAEVVP